MRIIPDTQGHLESQAYRDLVKPDRSSQVNLYRGDRSGSVSDIRGSGSATSGENRDHPIVHRVFLPHGRGGDVPGDRARSQASSGQGLHLQLSPGERGGERNGEEKKKLEEGEVS